MAREHTNRKPKVGIVTFYYQNHNFGGLLQAFALPKLLNERFDVTAEQVPYSLAFPNSRNQVPSPRHWAPGNLIYKMGIAFFATLTRKSIDTRKKAFDHFMDEIPHCGEVYDAVSVSRCGENYSEWICGGDQIWNASNGKGNLAVFTLQFAPKQAKKFAYAPSMAVLEMSSEGRECLRQGLAGLDHISVREKSSVEVLKTITDRPIEVVVDPVLLLRAEEWAQEARRPRRKKKYLLCYLLGDSISQRKAVTKLAKALGLQIVTFPHIPGNAVRKCDLFFGDVHDYTSGPREFLGLIQNAEFVITDSFHACVFSMIFQTPFVVFERSKPGEKGNMNSRVYDFLEEYHLQQQLVTEKTLSAAGEIPHVDFTFAHAHWKTRRAESIAYLENALKDEI